MGGEVNVQEVCARLNAWDNILILSHMNPDGDTLGSGFALLHALQKLGKRVRLECADGVPERYQFLCPGYQPEPFEQQHVVAVDIADTQLFGPGKECYRQAVDLCIDHHPSNTHYARETLLEPDSAATAEIICAVVDGLGVAIDAKIANCLYTGLSTDTGCFRFSNTTARTHRLAARLMEAGADYARINRDMFDLKSPSRIAVEREVYSTIEYYCGGRCAVACITRGLMEAAGAHEDELEGVASIPSRIEGVEVGVTLREREDGFKVSLRTNRLLNASEICAHLGGGGHERAAGCFLSGGLEQAKSQVLAVVSRAFEQLAASN